LAGKIVLNPASVFDLDGETVVRGQLDPNSLGELQRPSYQREVLSDSKIAELMEAYRTSRVPDVVLNMRGKRFQVMGDTIELYDPTYMVDGLQRITAGVRVMVDDSPATPNIGAYVTIDKDEAWEREQFEILNNKRTQLSPNVNLRNQREVVPAINTLFRLTYDQEFPLRGRVQWNQAMKKGELITATTYVKTVGRLHSHWGPGRGTNVFEVAVGIDRIMDEIGKEALRANIKAFFGLLVDCWDLHEVDHKGAPVLKNNFLFTVAELLGDFPEFWDGYFLEVSATVKSKLRTFKVNDPTVAQWIAAKGPGSRFLYNDLYATAFKSRRQVPTWDDVELEEE
jgi:hypothetical protein